MLLHRPAMRGGARPFRSGGGGSSSSIGGSRRRARPLGPPAARYAPGAAPPPPARRPPPGAAPPPAAAEPEPDADAVLLPRSVLVGKEVVTRTTGRRLGYVHELWVDPSRLEVVGVALRRSPGGLAAAAEDAVLLSSLRQIGDVVLVHDETALGDPPADDALGYVRLAGSEVVTEGGAPLGRVRDFVFDPDTGAVESILYDALGLPALPQSLLTCYALGWRDVLAAGPARTVVRRGAERRAAKVSDGWVSAAAAALVDLLAGDGAAGDAAAAAALGDDAYRAAPAYAEWYRRHAAAYEAYYGQAPAPPLAAAAAARPPPPAAAARRPAPAALPPPRATPYARAVRPAAPQRQRERVPAGGGGGGAPPPPRRQQQQQQQQARRGPPPPRPDDGAEYYNGIPQNGIPIIDRTPRPAYRRRDFDGGYGAPPPPAAAAATQEQQRGGTEFSSFARPAPEVVPDAVIQGQGGAPPAGAPPPPRPRPASLDFGP